MKSLQADLAGSISFLPTAGALHCICICENSGAIAGLIKACPRRTKEFHSAFISVKEALVSFVPIQCSLTARTTDMMHWETGHVKTIKIKVNFLFICDSVAILPN